MQQLRVLETTEDQLRTTKAEMAELLSRVTELQQKLDVNEQTQSDMNTMVEQLQVFVFTLMIFFIYYLLFSATIIWCTFKCTTIKWWSKWMENEACKINAYTCNDWSARVAEATVFIITIIYTLIVNCIYSAENEKLQELNAKVAELQKETNELTSELDATGSERDETKFVIYFLNIFYFVYYRRNVDKIDAERKSMTSKFQAVNLLLFFKY
jgi:hypothetical protein